MQVFKGHIEGGRVIVDGPTTNYPDGMEVTLYLTLQGGGDELDDEERAELHRALDEADRQLREGQWVSEDELWASLRARTQADSEG